MSPIPSFNYALLWRERSLRSVANLTRRDAEEFIKLAAQADIRATYTTYSLAEANDALLAIASDEVQGAAVIDLSR
jgi:propanol-preferring alcohol dehydrogenase